MSSIATMSERLRLLSQSFQAKLMLTLVLPLLIIGGLVALASAFMLQRQQDFLGEQQVSAAKLQANELNENIKVRFAILDAVANHLDATHLSDADYASNFLLDRPALIPLFS